MLPFIFYRDEDNLIHGKLKGVIAMLNDSILNKINQIPIFDVMQVKGYCVNIEGILRTFVFAEDIAREAGLVYEANKNYIRKKIIATSGDKNIIPQLPVIPSMNHEIRWNRFNEYINMVMPIIQQENPSLLSLIQLPVHKFSYMPCELALIVLMHCKSETALRFQVRLATIIMPLIQQQTIELYQREIQELESDMKTNIENINYNIRFLKDIAEFSPNELRSTIMNLESV